jgi:hypothetical protein
MNNRYIVRPLADMTFPWGVWDSEAPDAGEGFVGRFGSRAMADGVAASLNGGGK